MKSSTFWDITPCSPLKVNQRFGGTYRSAYSSTLKMEAICSSETFAEFQWSTRRYFPEDSTLQELNCSNVI
jgi:hypothetical protein